MSGSAGSPARAVWSGGDYRRIATLVAGLSERLVDTLDLRYGEELLDVASGTGSLGIAAARRGAEVTISDIVPELLAHAGERAAVEGVRLRSQPADAESLPFDDASFDVTASCIGVMFAPGQEAAAAEMVRVTRPGGRIGLVSWVAEGFLGELFALMGRYVPPPEGTKPAARWGSGRGLRDLFGDRVAWDHVDKGDWRLLFPSATAFADHFAQHYGPTVAALARLDEAEGARLREDLADLARRHDVARSDTIAFDQRYLLSVGTVI